MLSFLWETFRLGVKNLRLHKLRSLLTALGIILGVAAVIVMVAIGEGGKQAAIEQLRKLGAQNILIRSERPPEGSAATGRVQRVLDYGLRRSDLARVQTLPGIAAIVPMRDTEQRVVRNEVRVNAKAIATVPQVFDVINLRPARGRCFTQVDYDRASAVCVLGALAARQLFPYEDPLGQVIQVGSSGTASVALEVIGVLEPIGLRGEGEAMVSRDLDMDVYFPMKLGQRVFGDMIIKRQAGSIERKSIELTEIWLQARPEQDVEQLAAMVENLIAQHHPGPPDYQVKAPIQILRTKEQQTRMFNFIMGTIAGISLLVGGIGIMNIMLASVTERTREIGIRRALGAKRKHVTLQFLIETTVISLSGGVIGILAGIAGALLLPVIVAWFSDQLYPTAITTWSVVLSFAVAGGTGIVFGLYPAITAAHMDPIEALRHE
jgi:putative ABC transport system permease protein